MPSLDPRPLPLSQRLRPVALALTIAAVAAACAPAPNSRPNAGQPRPGPTPAPVVGTPTARWQTPGARLGVGGCPLFPPDHAWHASVGSLAVSRPSSSLVRATGDLDLRASFSARVWMGSRKGVPVNVVDGATARRLDVVVANDHGDTGAHLDVPLPAEPRFEGWPGKAWDAHLLTVDSSTCESRELINVREPADDLLGIGGGRWYADAAATFDLRSNEATGRGATASRSSLLAGLVRFDEVATGRIDHALSASLSEIAAGSYVWPAMGTDGRSQDPAALPMGSWLRLRAGTDLSRLGPQARVVARALQVHGAVLADTGPGFVIRGEPDLRWDDDDIDTLSTLRLSDFEVVDASPMMASPDSYRLRPQA